MRANQSIYRTLPPARRVELVLHVIQSSREARALYAGRLAQRGGGFRPQTLLSWAPDRLAREVVRLNAETPQDELDLLQTLYVELEPGIQATFLEAAGVKHEGGRIDEALEAPFADAEGVTRGVAAVRAQHGEDGERYLRTIARYNGAAWPGIEGALESR